MGCITWPADQSSAAGNERAATQAPRVMFLGTFGELSLLPLAALLDHGIPVTAVVVPRPRDLAGPAARPLHAGRSTSPYPEAAGGGVRRLEAPSGPLLELPLAGAPAAQDIVHLGWERQIPVLEVGRVRDPACLAALEPYRPDVICVSCFPQILPETVLFWPRFGCLNLHPSLLPAYRGPAPLFWQFRNGEERGGVTIHIMDPGIDSGDILLEEAFAIPDGITGAELARECARRGARLLVEAVRRLPSGTLPRTKQPAIERGSESAAPAVPYAPWPMPRDFEVPVTRPARWAFNFTRGVAEWGPVTIPVAGRRFYVRHAVGYTAAGTLGAAYVRAGDRWRIQFSPGILEIVAVETPERAAVGR